MSKSGRRRKQRARSSMVQREALPPIRRTSMMLQASSYSGPLPPAAEMERLEAIEQGMAGRIVAMAEKQAGHRQRLEATVVPGNTAAQRRGQWMAFVLGIGVLALAGCLVYRGNTWEAVVTLGVEVMGLATVFITGKVTQAKERIGKREKAD